MTAEVEAEMGQICRTDLSLLQAGNSGFLCPEKM